LGWSEPYGLVAVGPAPEPLRRLAPLREAGDLLVHDGYSESRLPAPSNAGVLAGGGSGLPLWTDSPDLAEVRLGQHCSVGTIDLGSGTEMVDVEMALAGQIIGGTPALVDPVGPRDRVVVTDGGPTLRALTAGSNAGVLHVAGPGAAPAWLDRSWARAGAAGIVSLDETDAPAGAPRLLAALAAPPSRDALLTFDLVAPGPQQVLVRQGASVLSEGPVAPGRVDLVLSNVQPEQPMELLLDTQDSVTAAGVAVASIQ